MISTPIPETAPALISTLRHHPLDPKIVYIEADQIEEAISWIRAHFIRAAIIPCPEPEAFAQAASNMHESIKHSTNFANDRPYLEENNAIEQQLRLLDEYVQGDKGTLIPFFEEQGSRTNTTWMHFDTDDTATVHVSIVGGIEFLTGDTPEKFKRGMENIGTKPNRRFESRLEIQQEWRKRVDRTNPGDITIFGDDFAHRTNQDALMVGWTFNVAYTLNREEPFMS